MEIFEVGSLITYNSRWSNPILTVIRETKTMFICDRGVRIYKKNNCIVGDSYTKARLVTQNDLDLQKKSYSC